MSAFSYDAAFERNLGWVTEAEQLALRGKKVAIAGLGGVGGAHLITLARLGIGAFHIADLDHFSLANFNRQMGANVNTIGRPKIEVMEEMALAVNPLLRVTRFDEGVDHANLEAFLSGVDLFVDGFDFFVMDIRRRVYARCHELGIPAVCAGPIGMSTGFLAFAPGGMSFEQYFRMEGRPEEEQYVRFLLGLVPKLLHQRYLVDPTRFNVVTKTGPSVGAACELCAGVATITTAKFLLRRGDVKAAPWNQQYDAFRGILAVTKLRWGLNGLIQRLKIRFIAPVLIKRMREMSAPPATFCPKDAVDEILHAARWAPSGDNEQTWRFEKLEADTVLIHLAPHDPRNVYYYRDNEPGLLAAGGLLENLRIAASAHLRRLEWTLDPGRDPIQIRVQFIVDQNIVPDPLYSAIGERSVDRGRYRVDELTIAERAVLEAALGSQLQVRWFSSSSDRWRFARLSSLGTNIRLRAPETFPIHQRIIDWQSNLSPTKIPAKAIGLSRPTRWIMHWALQNQRRMRLLTRLGGAFSAALETDYIPTLSSAAVFALRRADADQKASGIEAILRAGECIQRFWLTATRRGLVLQPMLSVLSFAHYGHHDLPFTVDSTAQATARRLAREFGKFFGDGPEDFVFMGRIGHPRPRVGVTRSVRRPLAELMWSTP
jgi:molybdopterin/thiamine biosynthesis adenylyltransferase